MNSESLSQADIFDVALQRTETLKSFPMVGSISLRMLFSCKVKLPLKIECYLRREKILNGAFLSIQAEIVEVAASLPFRSSIEVCDIGCGLGIANIFMAKKFPIERLLLVDIERTRDLYHDYNLSGSGYCNLSTSSRFIGLNSEIRAIGCCNPQAANPLHLPGQFDLMTSFISCGFHYPIETYLEFFKLKLKPEGRIVCDIRKGVGTREFESHFVVDSVVRETEKFRRTIYRRRC